MARTFIRQAAQIAGSEEYLDNLGPGSGLEGQETIEGDLNALRSMIKDVTGESKWFDGVSGRSVKGLDADLATAEADIGTLTTDLANEVARASAAEVVLQGNIDAEATSRTAADNALQGEIDAEEIARAAADTTLQNNITAEESRAMAAESALQGEIDAEEVARAAADVTLQNNIDAEASLRLAGDNTLQSNIDAEASARATAISTLQSYVDSADTTLQGYIDAESMARASADLSLQSNIDAEASARVFDVNRLDAAISAETTARQGDVATLTSNLNSEIAARMAADSALDARVSQNETDIVSLFGSVSTLETDVIYADGRRPFSGDQSMGGHALTNVAAPSAASDAVNKAYVDAIAVGLTIKAPVFAAGRIVGGALPDPSNLVDGLTINVGQRVFFFDPAGGSSLAGIYVLSGSMTWERAEDYAAGSDVSSTFFFVQRGSEFGDTSWVETADPAIVGTNALEFAQMFGPGTYSAGAGLDLNGREFSIEPGGVLSSMIGAGEVQASNIASGAVETAKIADGAVINAKIANSTIERGKLAFDVYTVAEADVELAKKLSRDGSLPMTGALNMNYNQINLLAEPTANADAATKYYVDQAVAGLDSRAGKTYAVVTSAVSTGFPLKGGVGGNLDAPLPVMPSDEAAFSSTFDIFLNGQLLRAGASNDVSRDAVNNQALVLTFDAAVGDVLCVVAYT